LLLSPASQILGQYVWAGPSCNIFTNILLATSRSSHNVLQSDVEGSLLARDKSRFSSLVTLVKDVMEKPKTYKHDTLDYPFPLF
jgi:hypothetical protein